MYASTKEFNTAIYNILTDINKSVPINDISQKFTGTDFDDAFEHCYNYGFINGIELQGKAISGKLHFAILNDGIRLTYKGLSFIENFNAQVLF